MDVHVNIFVCRASRVNLVVTMKLCLSYRVMNICHVYIPGSNFTKYIARIGGLL